jgi:hypothetical protein
MLSIIKPFVVIAAEFVRWSFVVVGVVVAPAAEFV